MVTEKYVFALNMEENKKYNQDWMLPDGSLDKKLKNI